MKAYEAIEIDLHVSSTSPLDGGDCFTPPTPYPRTESFPRPLDLTYAGPWAKYTCSTYGYVITAFSYSCHPHDVDAVGTIR